MKTIAIPEDLHKELMQMRIQKGDKNTAELIRELLFEFRQKKFLEASRLFRERLKEKNASFSEILKKSRKIREEISDEWL
jgi:predicted CopG family antitoxin